MSERPVIRGKSAAGDKLLVDGSLIITLKGTSKPVYKFKPAYDPELGPHVVVYRVLIDGDEDRIMILGAGGVASIIRWMPMVMSFARRLENQAKPRSFRRNKQQG